MKKFTFASLVTIALAVVVYFAAFYNPPLEDIYAHLPDDRARYARFMDEYLASMPQPDPEASKRNSPDMFYEFDKLKRMDWTTGEVPPNGLIDAYQALKEQFELESSAKTGNALTWVERGPTNVGGRTRALMWDPNDPNQNAVFAGGVGGGLWYCPDITASVPAWTSVSTLFSNVAVTYIAADPNNPQTMYYGTGEGWRNADALRGAGIWKSVDGGMNWEFLPSTEGEPFWYTQKIVIDDFGDVYIATKGGLFRSEDGGQTFDKVLGSLGFGASNDWVTDLDLAGNGDMYACINSNGIFKSPASLGTAVGDSGQWTRFQLTLPPSAGRIELTAGINNPNYVYAAVEAGFEVGAMYRTTNGGNNWSSMIRPNGNSDYSNGQAWYDLCIQVDPTDDLHVITGGINQHRTTNGGQSWTQISTGGVMHVDQHNIVFHPTNPNRILFGNDGGVYYSSNGGNTFNARNMNYNVTQFYSISVDPRPSAEIIIGGTQDNGTDMVQGPGIGVGIGLTGADGSFCAINYDDPDTMYTTFQYQTVLRSLNGGTSFVPITNPSLGQNDVLFINPLEMDPNNPRLIYQAARELWRRNNSTIGTSSGWIQATVTLGQITAIGISESTPNLLYFASNGNIYRMTNANAGNFTTQPTLLNTQGLAFGYVSCVAVDPNDGNHVLITYSSYGADSHVLETRDAQNGSNCSWKDLSGNLPDLPCNWVVFEPNNPNGLILGTDLGAFRCADMTQSEADIYWASASAGMGFPRIDMLEVRTADQTVHAATHGRGFFSTYSLTEQPMANFGIVTDTACGGTVQFIDSTSNVPNSWTWDFGDGGSSSLQSPAHTYAASGTYTVSLISSNPNGLDTSVQSINVVVVPGVTAFAGSDTSACPGELIQLNATGGTSYSWFPTAGLSDPNIANPVYTVAGQREFIVTVTNQFGCSSTDTVEVTASPQPSVWAGPDQTITIVGDSVQLSSFGADTYVWSPATGLSCTSCPDPKASPAVTTTYTLTGTNTSGCARTDDITVFVNIVGVEDELSSGIVLHPIRPNPVDQQLTVEYDLANGDEIQVELVGLNGQVLSVIESGWQDAGNHRVVWDREAGLAAGMYFVRLRNRSGSAVQRIMLTK